MPAETEAPVIRLAVAPDFSPYRTVHALSVPSHRPALLCSFVYLPQFMNVRPGVLFRDWAFDSGAFSAYRQGGEIHLGDYIRKCRELTANDPQLSEVYALDVIGDWRASLRNTRLMWKAGVEAIPCYHFGEPLDVLRGLARDYPKIAFGGVARREARQKVRWALDCMAAIWPKRVHGFGFGHQGHLMAVPFHSADATTWELRSCGFGQWKQFGNLPCRGPASQNLRGEVRWFLELERKLRARWRREMSEL